MRKFVVVYTESSRGQETVPADSYDLHEGWFTFLVGDNRVYQIRADHVLSIRAPELVPA